MGRPLVDHPVGPGRSSPLHPVTTLDQAPVPSSSADGTAESFLPRAGRWARGHPGLIVLLVIPFVVLLAPLPFGHVFLDGDNAIQNLPLRALVGHDLRAGILPLWNPYLFSGTPLLAGFNAGAAYPTTWLFAALPLFAGWTVNLALAYDVAILGMYLFLRRQPLDPTAATFGAATFAFAGYMAGQIVHIDLIQAASWVPWMLLAVYELSRPTAEPGAERQERGWVFLLGAGLGLALLSGGAEAVIDGGVLLAVYWVGRMVTLGALRSANRRQGLHSLVRILSGGVIGLALGAAQWIPGLAFQSSSQRAGIGYGFFTSGSLPWRLVTLAATPFVLGTNHTGFAYYAGNYNIQEVTSYAGVLALIAACSLGLRRWRSRPESRNWWIWYAVLGLGVLAAIGGATPFARLLFLVPIVNSERLLNRNLLLVDTALAVLFAWWVHLLLTRPDRRDPSASPRLADRWRHGSRAELVATCVPVAVIALVCLLVWALGSRFQNVLGVQVSISSTTSRRDALLVTGGLVIAVAATAVVLHEARLTVPGLRRALGTVLALDLVVLNVFLVAVPTSQDLATATGAAARQFTTLVGNARFAIYDPDQFNDAELLALGQTDLSVYNDLGSGQGYTALTDGTYAMVTGAHYQEDLAPASLAAGSWDDLDVGTLLSLPGYFMTPLPLGGSAPTAVSYPNPIHPYNGFPDAATGPVSLRPGTSHRWYFGSTLTLRSLQFTDSLPLGRGTPRSAVGLVGPRGQLSWIEVTGDQTAEGPSTGLVTVQLPPGTSAAGVVVRSTSPTGLFVGIPTVETVQGGWATLDGPMQYGTTWPHWAYTGDFGSFGVFVNTRALGWAWPSAPGRTLSRTTSVTAGPPTADGGQRIVVHAAGPLDIDRSVAFADGWEATAVNQGSGRSVRLPVVRDGLVQQVALPAAGTWVVTYRYRPTSAWVGVAISTLTVIAGMAWGIGEWTRVRRTRRRSRR